ncbi:hypothetical protein S40288_10180 [Stachybotrys chartarum IBT 40288]|nr:hypothetical protein S40288_10180 [Stachybotrys chartarum IBT 40288]
MCESASTSMSPSTPTTDGGFESTVPRNMMRQMDSDSEPSVVSDGASTSQYRSSTDSNPSAKKPRWFSHVKQWLVVSEPSAQAMKAQKTSLLKQHGIHPKDPQAAAKMHIPAQQLPANVITSTSGPRPEKALEKQKAEGVKKRESYAGFSRINDSVSSGFSSNPSIRESNYHIAPWEEQSK